MGKKIKTPLGIFIESIGLYFSNFGKFTKYMTFPVLGQILGLTLSLLLSYFYAIKMPIVIEKFPNLANFELLLIIAILVLLPGLAIFMKAFWEYLVAYGALNSMFENMVKSGKVYDFDAHTDLIKRRTIPFIGLWLLFSIFSLLAIVPFFWIPCAVFTVYFVLIFQVFTFEPTLSPISCVKKSLSLIKGHFASTFMLFSLVGALTYVLIPQIITTIFESIKIVELLSNTIKPLIVLFPLENINSLLKMLYLPGLSINQISTFAITTLIAQIFIQYTLPLRSILWSMWYKNLNKNSSTDTNKKATSKRPSERLMQESHKKYKSQKLDRNLLKRAMEKPDDLS